MMALISSGKLGRSAIWAILEGRESLFREGTGQDWGEDSHAVKPTGDRLTNRHARDARPADLWITAEVDVRVFADLGSLLPRSALAKRTRVTLGVEKIANQRQRVSDSSGDVPLSYQGGYRDPVGRAVMFEIRKAF